MFKKIRKSHVDWQKFLCGVPARDYIFQNASYEEQIEQANKLLRNADAIIIGAGAGASTAAGIQLRLEMNEIMTKQGHEEETGRAKITSGYNLPAKYILHTVGPIIQWKVSKEDEDLLASCYRECLKLAADNGVESIAFCCLSTGVFRFPQQRAAEIAIATFKEFLDQDDRIKKVIFNVFKDEDLKIYKDMCEA